jgi:RNA polymerase sigma-70 factor (ECF subfamily)
MSLVDAAVEGSDRPGPMTLQAAIAAEHAIAPTLPATNWARIVELYGELLELEPSATIAVGRCVAIAQLSGPAAGLADLDDVVGLGGLERYPYAFGARAQMLAALGRHEEAAQAWSAAAERARTDAERDYFAAQGRDPGTSRPTRAP